MGGLAELHQVQALRLGLGELLRQVLHAVWAGGGGTTQTPSADLNDPEAFWRCVSTVPWPLAAAALLIPILRRRGDVSALVAGLIRFLIPLQILWLTLAPVPFWLLAALALCWPLAALAGRRVAGS